MAAETAEGGNMEATPEQWGQKEPQSGRNCLVTRLLGVAEGAIVHCATATREISLQKPRLIA